jgi:hypothetical protein
MCKPLAALLDTSSASRFFKFNPAQQMTEDDRDP